MQVNPLLTIQSPRDIPEVIDNLNKITKYDKLWIKYYNNSSAMRRTISYFKKHKEYTHLVRISDDTIITTEIIDKLIKDIRNNPKIEVIGGVGPVDSTDLGSKLYGICMNKRPSKEQKTRQYEWLPKNEAPTIGLYKVKFGGGYCPFFSRRLIDDNIITLELDTIAKTSKDFNTDTDIHGCCTDVITSHQLAEAGVDEWIDFGVFVNHLKRSKRPEMKLKVSKKKPFVKLIGKTND